MTEYQNPPADDASAAHESGGETNSGEDTTEASDYKKPFKTPPQWLIPKISRTHVALYKLTSGKIGSNLAGKPGLLLRTVGRRSGKPHTVCLPYLPDDDNSKVIVASFAGAERNPAWYHNLKANPEVIIRDKRNTYWAKAIIVEGAERPALWDKVVADSPWYGDYQTKTTRQIPLVRLVYDRPY